MLDVERLRTLLHYDPDTGRFTWNVSPSKNVSVGSSAGGRHTQGYIRISIDNKLYYAHRVAWMYMHGQWPAQEIDHINGIRADNRISNLRQASSSENNGNMRRSVANTSGYKGVSWDASRQKWTAAIIVNGKKKHLGRFDDPREAHSAYIVAAERCFGEFARAA